MEFSYRGQTLRLGDRVKITICKNVDRTGHIIFKDAAFCVEYVYCGAIRNTPLTNYSYNTKLEIINSEHPSPSKV